MNHQGKKVLVIGAGLSGLVSALTLQRSGYRVKIIEKRSAVGGLCGTFTMDGFEFVIACNDFGSGLVKLLRQLDVDLPFEYKRSSVFYKGQWYNAAPDAGMLLKLKHDWWNLLKLLGGIVMQQLPSRAPATIEDFANRYTGPGPVNDLAKLIAYFMGVAPSDIHTSYFGLDGHYGYGYTKMACPVGGPQALVDAIAEAFVAQGGELLLNTTFLDSRTQANNFQVSNFEVDTFAEGKQTTLQADHIIDTTGSGPLYSPEVKRGIPLSVLCLAVDDVLEYPADTHTLTFYEPDVSTWFSALDRGVEPKDFGFHVFKSDLRQNPEGIYTLNAYFYLPRGVRQLDEEDRARYGEYLLARLEKLVPGLGQHLRYHRIVTPDDFEQMHGLSSRVMPFIGVVEKPPNVTDVKGFYRAGHNVFPPGEHAGAAALSGHLVAKRLMEASVSANSKLSRGQPA